MEIIELMINIFTKAMYEKDGLQESIATNCNKSIEMQRLPTIQD